MIENVNFSSEKLIFAILGYEHRFFKRPSTIDDHKKSVGRILKSAMNLSFVLFDLYGEKAVDSTSRR